MNLNFHRFMAVRIRRGALGRMHYLHEGLPRTVFRGQYAPPTFSLTLAKGDQQDVTLTGHMRITGRSDSELTTARRDLERAARQVRTKVLPIGSHSSLVAQMARIMPNGGRTKVLPIGSTSSPSPPNSPCTSAGVIP